jgi:hypothetical protein
MWSPGSANTTQTRLPTPSFVSLPFTSARNTTNWRAGKGPFGRGPGLPARHLASASHGGNPHRVLAACTREAGYGGSMHGGQMGCLSADTRPTEVATTGEARSSPKRRCNARRWLNCWAGWANPTTTKTTRPENLRRSGLAPTEAPVMAAAGLDAASWYRTALSERADL